MKLLVVFEFEGVDPESEQGSQIVEMVAESCDVMRVGFDAQACYVQEVYGEENHA